MCIHTDFDSRSTRGSKPKTTRTTEIIIAAIDSLSPIRYKNSATARRSIAQIIRLKNADPRKNPGSRTNACPQQAHADLVLMNFELYVRCVKSLPSRHRGHLKDKILATSERSCIIKQQSSHLVCFQLYACSRWPVGY